MPGPFKALALLTLLAAAASGAEVLPTAGKAVGLVRDDTPGGWAVIAPDGEVAAVPFDGDDTKGYLGCYFQGLPGRYTVIKVNGFKIKTFAVTLGGTTPPTPPDVPPKPPVVIPNPPVPGPRQVLILHESGDDNPAMSRLLVSMASTKGREYLKSKGHAYFNFDVDGKRPDGTPDPNVVAWKAALNVPLPAIAILDSSGAVLFKVSLADGTTTDDVISILRSNGG